MVINLLRWVILLPLSLSSAIIIPMIIKLMGNLGFFSYRGSEVLPFYAELGMSFVMGATFVFVGKSIAPSNKVATAKLLFILSIIIFAALFFINWQQGETLAALYTLPALLGAYLAKDYDF